MDGAFPVYSIPSPFVKKPFYRNSLDEHRKLNNFSTSTTSTKTSDSSANSSQIQRVHRKPVASNPILKSSLNTKLHKNYAAADTIHPMRMNRQEQQLREKLQKEEEKLRQKLIQEQQMKQQKLIQEQQIQQQKQQYQRTRRYSQGSYLLKKQQEQQHQSPLLKNDIILRASMSTTSTPTSFWYPRTESQTEPLEPLKRGLSKKLRGLLLPHRTFIERGDLNNKQYIQGYHTSLQRCTSPTTVQHVPLINNHSRMTSKKWEEKEFIQIDNYVSTVQQRGPLLTPSLLSQKFLVRPYRKDLFRLRALFIWIVQNIRPEYHARRADLMYLIQQQGVVKKKRTSNSHQETMYMDCQPSQAMRLLEEEATDLLLELKQSDHESADHVLEKRTCKSSFGMAHLFVTMAQAAGFEEAKVVYGYLKGPKDTLKMVDQKLPLNHAWCSVKIEGEYRFIDCWLASPYHPQNNNGVDSHWFLTTPLDMFMTHLPQHAQQQYLNPTLGSSEFFKLPYVRHAFFRYPIRVLNYQIRQEDEKGLFYVAFEVTDKHNVSCFAETESEQDGTLLRGLAQCTLDDHDRRTFKIKGVLPPGHASGWLKIYLGPQQEQQQEDQLESSQEGILKKPPYPLSMCIYIQQECSVEEDLFEFVKMYVDHNEFYINEPQCYQLYPLQNYRFCIKANRLEYYYNRSTHYKLAVKSPSGKIFKLMYYPQDQTYDGHVTISEAGKWSLVCLLHNTGGSYTVASWNCKVK